MAFPIPDGRYGQIAGAPGRALFTSFPVHGACSTDDGNWDDDEEPEFGTLRAWVFKDYKSENVADNVTALSSRATARNLVYHERAPSA